MTSRQEIREGIEDALDANRPRAQRAKTWGKELTPAQWELLQKTKGKKEVKVG